MCSQRRKWAIRPKIDKVKDSLGEKSNFVGGHNLGSVNILFCRPSKTESFGFGPEKIGPPGHEI
jgi:hypothetical protein